MGDGMRGVFHGFDIAAAGMRAEMHRAEVVSANISNMHVTGGKDGEPYRRKSLVFEEVLGEARGAASALPGGNLVPAGVGVREVYEDRVSPFVPRYDPGHPDADDSGFVLMSNVDLVRELVDLSVIERSFQANLAAMNTYRGMLRATVSNIGRA